MHPIYLAGVLLVSFVTWACNTEETETDPQSKKPDLDPALDPTPEIPPNPINVKPMPYCDPRFYYECKSYMNYEGILDNVGQVECQREFKNCIGTGDFQNFAVLAANVRNRGKVHESQKLTQAQLIQRYEKEFGTALRLAKGINDGEGYLYHLEKMRAYGLAAQLKSEDISFHATLIEKAYQRGILATQLKRIADWDNGKDK